MSTYDWPQTNLINQSHVSTNSSKVSLTLFFNIEKEYYCKKIVMFTFMDFNALHDEMEDFVDLSGWRSILFPLRLPKLLLNNSELYLELMEFLNN